MNFFFVFSESVDLIIGNEPAFSQLEFLFSSFKINVLLFVAFKNSSKLATALKSSSNAMGPIDSLFFMSGY